MRSQASDREVSVLEGTIELAIFVSKEGKSSLIPRPPPVFHDEKPRFSYCKR